MAERVEWFDVTVSASTAKTAPVEKALAFNQGTVERLDLTIPDGHAGLTGIRFNSAHQQVIPLTASSFIIGNDHVFTWDLHGFPDNGSWSVSMYNTDIYDHTFHIAFLVNELSTASAAPVALVSPAALGSTVVAPPTLVSVAGAAPPAFGG